MVYSGRTSWQVSTALEALGANHQLPSKRLSFPHFYLHSQAPFALCIILKVENTFRSSLALFSTEANFPGFSFFTFRPQGPELLIQALFTRFLLVHVYLFVCVVNVCVSVILFVNYIHTPFSPCIALNVATSTFYFPCEGGQHYTSVYYGSTKKYYKILGRLTFFLSPHKSK